jgi:hypothetical protein
MSACASTAPTGAQEQFDALKQCWFSYCVLDASRLQIGNCISAVNNNANQCQPQANACM